MTDETENLILAQLRAIRAKVDRAEQRFESVESRLLSIEGHLGALVVADTRQNTHLAQLELRIDRIESRLELN